MATPHDKLAKTVFSQLEHARPELASLLPTAIVERVRWDTLALVSGEFVDPPLAHLHTDLLYTVQIGSAEACIYVLFEHMSTVERTMAFRLLRYMTRVWERFEQDRPGKPLPVIIPVVLHHSDAGWTAPTQFRDLLDLGDDVRVAGSPFVPDFTFVLDDLSRLDDEALRGRALTELGRLTLLVLQRCRGAEDKCEPRRLSRAVPKAARRARLSSSSSSSACDSAPFPMKSKRRSGQRALPSSIAGPSGCSAHPR